MKAALLATVGAFALVSFGTYSWAQEGTEVVHHLTVATERAAIKEIADRFNAAGGNWIDNAVAGPPNSRRVYSSRMAAGDPPQAYVTVTNLDHHAFAEQGLLADLDEVAAAEKWTEVFPPEIIETMMAP